LAIFQTWIAMHRYGARIARTYRMRQWSESNPRHPNMRWDSEVPILAISHIRDAGILHY